MQEIYLIIWSEVVKEKAWSRFDHEYKGMYLRYYLAQEITNAAKTEVFMAVIFSLDAELGKISANIIIQI